MTAGQLTLDGQIEAPAVKLTGRQRFALEVIDRLGPVASDELGAHLHERRARHGVDERCRWCGQEGNAAGRELRTKGFVKLRRSEGWVLAGVAAKAKQASSEYDPATAAWPEGF